MTCIYLTQKYRALAPEIRVNMNALMLFRQRSRFDLEAFLEENSAIVPKEQLYQMYRRATSIDHGFLYCDLMQRDASKMFFSSFNARLVPKESLPLDSMEDDDLA